MDIERIVVFGHRPNTQWSWRAGFYSHTHSYIHAGYFRAFRSLGFKTLWIDAKSDGLANLPTKGTLFFTEGQAESKMPLSTEAGYVTHSSTSEVYDSLGLKRLQLFNYVADLKSGKSFAFPNSRVEEIDPVTYIDVESKALYQPWATNLLPHEIETSGVSSFDPTKGQINYVGTIGHDSIKTRMRKIRRQANHLNVRFRVFSGVDDYVAAELTQNSLIGFDIRGDWHLERGYIPCRVWKTLSYGKHLTSNSPLLKGIFQDRISVEPDIDVFLHSAIEESRIATKESLIDNMKWVRDNHTFVNRAKRCLEAFRELCG